MDFCFILRCEGGLGLVHRQPPANATRRSPVSAESSLRRSQANELMDWLKTVLAGRRWGVKAISRLESHPCVITVEEMGAARHFVRTQFTQYPKRPVTHFCSHSWKLIQGEAVRRRVAAVAAAGGHWRLCLAAVAGGGVCDEWWRMAVVGGGGGGGGGSGWWWWVVAGGGYLPTLRCFRGLVSPRPGRRPGLLAAAVLGGDDRRWGWRVAACGGDCGNGR
ncbi:uncharacterized protein [Procambarus clarkii]|uniref:uncharacterized protein isoform X2 n=1 Tax=Procambarus clarkii TaxID=6728 RepID=UPI003743EF10